jgi:hypothetical protein
MVCVGIYSEKGHELVATTETAQDGHFALEEDTRTAILPSSISACPEQDGAQIMQSRCLDSQEQQRVAFNSSVNAIKRNGWVSIFP